MSAKIFVNLPVKDLQRSKDFFTKVGYGLDLQFSDENAACVVVSDSISVMLLNEKFFKGFSKKEICDISTHRESIIALSVDTPEEVDTLADAALEAGGQRANAPMKMNGMYGRSFLDPDGHMWEFVCMPAAPLEN